MAMVSQVCERSEVDKSDCIRGPGSPSPGQPWQLERPGGGRVDPQKRDLRPGDGNTSRSARGSLSRSETPTIPRRGTAGPRPAKRRPALRALPRFAQGQLSGALAPPAAGGLVRLACRREAQLVPRLPALFACRLGLPGSLIPLG